MQVREEYRTSLERGLAVACIAGVTGFLSLLPQEAGPTELIVAGVVPFLTTVGGFLSFGLHDAHRNDQAESDPRPRRRRAATRA